MPKPSQVTKYIGEDLRENNCPICKSSRYKGGHCIDCGYLEETGGDIGLEWAIRGTQSDLDIVLEEKYIEVEGYKILFRNRPIKKSGVFIFDITLVEPGNLKQRHFKVDVRYGFIPEHRQYKEDEENMVPQLNVVSAKEKKGKKTKDANSKYERLLHKAIFIFLKEQYNNLLDDI